MINKSFIDANCIYPDFPKPGIKFVDVFPCIEKEPLMKQLREIQFEGIVLLPEARGFLFYDAIANKPNVAVVPLRKEGKMPGSCIPIPIVKEYGEDRLYLQADALLRAVDKLQPTFGNRIPVMVFDDILATGGTVLGIVNKVSSLDVTAPNGERVSLNITGAAFYIELEALPGRKSLEAYGLKVQSVVKY